MGLPSRASGAPLPPPTVRTFAHAAWGTAARRRRDHRRQRGDAEIQLGEAMSTSEASCSMLELVFDKSIELVATVEDRVRGVNDVDV